MSLMLFIAMIIVVFLSFTIPIFFWGKFGYKTKGFPAAVIIGAAVYVVYYLIIRTSALSITSGMNAIIASFIRAGFYALGITLMNFLSYKMLTVTGRDEKCYFAIGVGEALAESAIVVGMAYMNNIFYSFMIMNGSFTTHMANAGFDAETISMLENTLTNFPVSALFLSGFERMLFSSALILAATGFAGYSDSKEKIRALMISLLSLFIAYLIPSLLANLEDDSLVYVSMCFMGIAALFVTWILSRRGLTLFTKGGK